MGAEIQLNSSEHSRIMFLNVCSAMHNAARTGSPRTFDKPLSLLAEGTIAAMNRSGDGVGYWIDASAQPLLVMEVFNGASVGCIMTTDQTYFDALP